MLAVIKIFEIRWTLEKLPFVWFKLNNFLPTTEHWTAFECIGVCVCVYFVYICCFHWNTVLPARMHSNMTEKCFNGIEFGILDFMYNCIRLTFQWNCFELQPHQTRVFRKIWMQTNISMALSNENSCGLLQPFNKRRFFGTMEKSLVNLLRNHYEILFYFNPYYRSYYWLLIMVTKNELTFKISHGNQKASYKIFIVWPFVSKKRWEKNRNVWLGVHCQRFHFLFEEFVFCDEKEQLHR